jgi:hypothetical protein
VLRWRAVDWACLVYAAAGVYGIAKWVTALARGQHVHLLLRAVAAVTVEKVSAFNSPAAVHPHSGWGADFAESAGLGSRWSSEPLGHQPTLCSRRSGYLLLSQVGPAVHRA